MMPWWAVCLLVTFRGRRFPGAAETAAARLRGPVFPCAGGWVAVFRGDSGAAGAGLLARVMEAGAVRVTVSFGLAWSKVLGDFDLRERCRFRSAVFRNLAIWLARAV